METLRTYLNSLSKEERIAFVAACGGTTENYLRKAISTGQNLSAELCILIEQASDRKVTCEDLRPDVQWAYLREPKPAVLIE